MRTLYIALSLLFFASCQPEQEVVNVYSHRHYDSDQDLFDKFEAETGIKVNVVSASADELIVRMQTEGEASPADVLITSDVSRLIRADEAGLLQEITSPEIFNRLPKNLCASNRNWIPLTQRVRLLVYSKERVNPDSIFSIDSLVNPQWENRILVRSSANEYNQSLMAGLIAYKGEEGAQAWAEGIVQNMARNPQGNDRDQIKAIAAGEGDIAIVNSYYVGKLINSDNAAEQEAANKTAVFYPEQGGRGAHVNISGAGIIRTAPNKHNALRLLEFLTDQEAQQQFADANYEFPVNPAAQASELLQSWGAFKADTLSIETVGQLNRRAVEVFNRAGWN